MNGPLDKVLRRKQLEQFAGLLAERRRRQAKQDHQTRGYRDENGVWRCGLLSFVRYFWHVLEPGTPFVDGWPLEAVCEHLEAVTFGEIRKILINIFPGAMKSLLVDVFWPAWEWGPQGLAHLRYVAFSYSASITERDNLKMYDLISSAEYQALYSNEVQLRLKGATKISNAKHGWKRASSVGGVGTGERGDRIILDDPHNVKESESDVVRGETVRWFRESMSSRLNNIDTGAIVVIMQRVHEDDVSGVILSLDLPYEHLCIPMHYVWDADEDGNPYSTSIGWVDPRWTPEPDDCNGVLAWEDRFPAHAVDELETTLGPYAAAGQLEQTPEARGGGVLKREYWQDWQGKFPSFSYIYASLDGAFTEDEQNDPSAMTIWGVWENEYGHNRLMLVFAWQKWLQFEGEKLVPEPGENQQEFLQRQMKEWGLVEWVAHTCNYWKVDRLLIEAKATGISVAQSLQRRMKARNWSIQLEQVKGDKVARAIAVQASFSQSMIWAPREREWCRKVIDEAAVFPFGKYKDLTDSVTQAVKHARDLGLLEFDDDVRAQEIENARLPEGRSDDKLKNYLPGT
jgi:predicted phage terminase large subunit-like protein